MVIWVLLIVLLAFAALLQDFLLFQEKIVMPDNIFWAVLLDILLLLVALGMLYRLVIRQRIGEREKLEQRVRELEEIVKKRGG